MTGDKALELPDCPKKVRVGLLACACACACALGHVFLDDEARELLDCLEKVRACVLMHLYDGDEALELLYCPCQVYGNVCRSGIAASPPLTGPMHQEHHQYTRCPALPLSNPSTPSYFPYLSGQADRFRYSYFAVAWRSPPFLPFPSPFADRCPGRRLHCG